MSDASFAPNQSGAVYGATLGIARNMQAEPEPLAGGDLNGTAATTILFSHAGTPASALGVPRALGNPNMGIASPVMATDFAVDDHPHVEPEPEGELGDMIASGELDEIMSATEPEPEGVEAGEPEPIGAAEPEGVEPAPIGEAGEAIEPEPEPEPEHHSRHHGKRRK